MRYWALYKGKLTELHNWKPEEFEKENNLIFVYFIVYNKNGTSKIISEVINTAIFKYYDRDYIEEKYPEILI